LEPSHPFSSHLAPVLAADGPGSSHPPASSNGVVLPLIQMIPFLSQGSIQPIFLAATWTDFGDQASPWPSDALVLTSWVYWPHPSRGLSILMSALGSGWKHSLLHWAPACGLLGPREGALQGTKMGNIVSALKGVESSRCGYFLIPVFSPVKDEVKERSPAVLCHSSHSTVSLTPPPQASSVSGSEGD
jgi:hypothetical protein